MIIFTETFYEDLRNIWDFIALDNVSKATEVTEEITNYCLKYLTVVPHMGQLLNDFPEIRKLTGPYEYSIVFQNTENATHVLMVYKGLKGSGKMLQNQGFPVEEELDTSK